MLSPLKALDCLYRNSVNYTLCDKHSIIITPSSVFVNFPDLQRNLCGSYVILYCWAIGSPIAILCDFALQSYAFFSRLSTLSRALGVDSVLFTEIQQGSFGNAEKFCGTPPCTSAIISL